MDEITTTKELSKPWLFAYSLILPAVWFTVGIVMMSVAPGVRLGTSLSIVMYGAAALGMGWLFLRRHGRLFSARESWRMVIYCSLLAVLMESWALLAMLTWPEDYPGVSISPESAKFAILIAAIIDSLAMLIAFKVGIPKYLGKYVPMNDEESAHDA